jgi:hypothetical protein
VRYPAKPRFWRVAAFVFALVVLIDYLPILTGQIPFPRDLVVRHSAWNGEPREQLPELIDVVALFYPFRALLGRAVEERELPLWNPYIMAGAPFEANAQSALFYPLNIFYYVLPLKIAWAANAFMRLFLAAMFMALFVRSIGGTATGSIISGILFALCGYTIQWHGMSNGESSIWLPLMCYAVHRLHVRPGRRSIAIAALAFPLPLLAGHPETAAHSTMAVFALAVFLWLFPHRQGAGKCERRFVLNFGCAGVLALGLASVQLIPTFEWLGELGLHVEAPEPVLDRHQGQGFFSRDITRNPSTAGLRIPEAATYVGMLGLLAASLAAFHVSRRYVLFLAAMAVLAAAVAFGIEPLRWVIVHVPILKAMKNGRLTLVVDFALAAMAGLGVSAVGEQFVSTTRKSRRRAVFLIVTASVVIMAGIYEVHRATWVPVPFLRSPAGSLLFLFSALTLLLLRLKFVHNDRAFALAVCAFAGVEMLSFSYGYGGFTSMRDVFPAAPVFDFLRTRDNSTPFRVAKDRVPMPHDAGMIYGFETADGYDLTTSRIRSFTSDLVENRDDGVMFLAEKILAVRDRRLDMLNVKYLMVTQPGAEFDLVSASNRFARVFSQGAVAVFENTTVLPRFYCVPQAGIEVIPEAAAQLARIKDPSFDPERSVILSEDPGFISQQSSSPVGVAAHIAILSRGMNETRLRAECGEPSVLVASQTYYPGWKATVDNSDVAVHSVNVALTGVVVPGGSHEVRLFFRPAAFRIGLAVSVLSAVVVLLLFHAGLQGIQSES